MSDTDHSLDGDGSLAAEYALGVLGAAERRMAERRLAEDPAFAAEVAAWQRRLAPLAETVAPVAPPAPLWRRIESAIEAETSPPTPAPKQRPDLWHRLGFWRGLAFGSLGLAAASLAALAVVLTSPRPAGPLVASLAPQSGPAVFLAAFDPSDRKLVVVPAVLSGAQQRVPELWLIPPGGAPRSLGLLDPTRPTTVSLPADLVAQAGPQAALAVSLEPPGGSPTGAPTGPVVAQGKLRSL